MNDIMELLIAFRDKRNWRQFHTPENLAKSIVLEAAELLENFQWKSECDDIDNIKEELADIMTYCLYMCNEYQFDVNSIMLEKIAENEKKYPIEKSYGNSSKYDKL